MANLTLPEVRTLARPTGADLVAARQEVLRNADIQSIFLKYKGMGMGEESASKLAAELEPFDLSREAAQYLAAEYLQMKEEGTLIIDRDTGRAIALITEDDIWQPPAVPREDGSLAVPLPTIKPAIKGFLISWKFERERETRLVNELSASLVQTDLDRELGNSKLLATTLNGRKALAEQLREALPTLLNDVQQGDVGKFMSMLRTSPIEGFDDRKYAKTYTGLRASSDWISVQLQDGKARNLQFDILSNHKATIVSQWVRAIAREITKIVHEDEIHLTKKTVNGLPKYGFWVAPAEEIIALRPVVFATNTKAWGSLISEGSKVTQFWFLNQLLGYITITDTYLTSREIHDRWEVRAELAYSLCIDVSDAIPWDIEEWPIPEAIGRVVK